MCAMQTNQPQHKVIMVPSTPTPLVDPNGDLKWLVHKAIVVAAPKISPARKKIYESIITHVALDVFGRRRDYQKYWIALLGVESGYNGAARSSKGAIGLGQLMPAYRKDFGAGCGITQVELADLSADYLNAYLSACYLRSLIQESGGSVTLALVAYNAGMYSKDFAKAKQGKQPSKEPRLYRKHIMERAGVSPQDSESNHN